MVTTFDAPAATRSVSPVGAALAVALLVVSAVPGVMATVLAPRLEVGADYPGLGLAVLIVPIAATLYLMGAIAATATFWPERKGVGRLVLAAAALPWVIALLASLPFLFRVCTRAGGACG